MERKSKGFKSYPIWIVLVCNLISLSVYFAGVYLFYRIEPLLALLFAIYIFYLEVSIYKESCRYCCYYGKTCAFGRGKIVKLFLKKGSLKRFSERTVNWKDFIPHALVSVFIVAAGVYLLIQDFSWLILSLTLWPIIIFPSNQIIYGQLACPNCQQAQIGCPVCDFFMKRAGRGSKKG